MSTEAALHFAKARKLLVTARRLLQEEFADEAAREAYLAAFHAAQAYIVDHAGRAAKTHAGAHSQFAQLAMHERTMGEEMLSFLPKAFKLKTIVDYEFGEGSDIPPERAADAVENAGRFVDCIAGLLGKREKKAAVAKAARKRKE